MWHILINRLGHMVLKHKLGLNLTYTIMCPNSFWVSLVFECTWTFLLGEIGSPFSEQGPIAIYNELFH